MAAGWDPRLDFLESCATALLRVSPDEWSKFLGSEEVTVMLDKFFKQQDMLELVLGLNPAGQLLPTACFPPTLKGKGIYFVKKENITQENCRSGLLVGDVGPSPMKQLITVLQEELEVWATDFVLPASVWLAGFFNPQSFLTAIMQSTARKKQWPLDKMCLVTDVTKKPHEDITFPPREGSYVHGLFMEAEGADVHDAIILLRAIPVDRVDTTNIYECPVYKTQMQGPAYVWTFYLKTKEKAAKWVLAGVALLLEA